jgi:signal transduction histidine kinase
MGKAEDGLAINIAIIGMAVIFLLSIIVVLFFIIYQRRLFAQQTRHQEKEAQHQRDLLKAVIASQEIERNRIGKELHDDIGAMLTTTKIYTNQLSPELSPNEWNAITQKIGSFFDDMIQNTRRISQDLRPVILENLGLIEAIEQLIKPLNDSKILQIYFEFEKIEIHHKSIELNLYRVVQEMLANTLKHANASEVKIYLKKENDTLILNYQDDGNGIDTNKTLREKGIGLKNIESRISILDGKIAFKPTNQGVYIQLEIPLEKMVVKIT